MPARLRAGLYRGIVILAVNVAISLPALGSADDSTATAPAPPSTAAPASSGSPTPEPAPLPPKAQEETPPPAEHKGYFREKVLALEKTMDRTHDRLEHGMLEQAIRLDSFFGNVKTEQTQQKTKYELRWRTSVRADHKGHLNLGTSAMANVVLSRISERLRLAISGGDEPEPVAPGLPEDPGNPGFDRTLQSTRLVNTELRYSLLHSPTHDLFVGAGVRLILPPEAFVRARYQYIYHLSDVSLARFGETLFVKNTVGPGQTTEFGLERSLDPKTILRWSNSGTISYEITGVEWGTELSLLHEISTRDAITFTGGVYGNTSVRDWVTNYRILARYRRNFYRPWLFYEIEPEVSWPRSAAGYFPTSFAVTFRLEVLFRGTDTGDLTKAAH